MPLDRLGVRTATISNQLNWLIERVCAVLMIALVLDVWLGVLARYVLPIPLTFMEEAARYLMIWTALLAISCGIARREHIGVLTLFDALPKPVRRLLLALIDLIAFGFFAVLVFYGLGLVEKGGRQFTMIYGMTKSLPFAAVPTGAALACVQLILVGIRDQAAFGNVEPGAAEAPYGES